MDADAGPRRGPSRARRSLRGAAVVGVLAALASVGTSWFRRRTLEGLDFESDGADAILERLSLVDGLSTAVDLVVMGSMLALLWVWRRSLRERAGLAALGWWLVTLTQLLMLTWMAQLRLVRSASDAELLEWLPSVVSMCFHGGMLALLMAARVRRAWSIAFGVLALGVVGMGVAARVYEVFPPAWLATGVSLGSLSVWALAMWRAAPHQPADAEREPQVDDHHRAARGMRRFAQGVAVRLILLLLVFELTLQHVPLVSGPWVGTLAGGVVVLFMVAGLVGMMELPIESNAPSSIVVAMAALVFGTLLDLVAASDQVHLADLQAASSGNYAELSAVASRLVWLSSASGLCAIGATLFVARALRGVARWLEDWESEEHANMLLLLMAGSGVVVVGVVLLVRQGKLGDPSTMVAMVAVALPAATWVVSYWARLLYTLADRLEGVPPPRREPPS